MFTEALNFDIVQVELNDVFYPRFDELETIPSLAKATTGELFKPVETDYAAQIEMVFAGAGLFPQIGETVTVPSNNPAVRNKLTTYVLDFASSIPLSKDLFDDNHHNVWAEAVRDFADKAKATQDWNSFKVIRGAFGTTLGADGVSLINATHPLIGGGTASNLVTGGITSDNINSAVVSLMQQVDQKGVIRGNVPYIFLVPPQQFKVAIEQTQSALLSDTANNTINFFRSEMGMMVMMSPWMGAAAGGSDTAWFLLARNHGIRRLIRQGVETALTPWQYSTNRTYNYQANFRENAYAIDWAGSVGSTG